VRLRTNRVSRWQDGKMGLRWVAAAFLETEKNFRRILGYRDLWMLKVKLDNQVVLDSKQMQPNLCQPFNRHPLSTGFGTDSRNEVCL
jgi:hypothetical protein